MDFMPSLVFEDSSFWTLAPELLVFASASQDRMLHRYTVKYGTRAIAKE